MYGKTHNRPFYSCLLSDLAFGEVGGDLVLIQTSLFCCCVNQVLMLNRCIYMTRAKRSVSKQSHLQPLCYFKVQFAEYGRTRRDLARADAFFAPFSFNFLDISCACTCHTLQTGLRLGH